MNGPAKRIIRNNLAFTTSEWCEAEHIFGPNQYESPTGSHPIHGASLTKDTQLVPDKTPQKLARLKLQLERESYGGLDSEKGEEQAGEEGPEV